MSASCQQSQCRVIPTRTVVLNDTTQLPHDYCTTPGGTLFSTTPGGTRIIYDRKFLMDCRHSPIAKTPPRYLPHIPGVTTPGIAEDTKAEANNAAQSSGITREGKSSTGDEAQFEMDI
ncbi:eukaryotic translation initiation factor 4E-binding protein 2-like [Amblyraja radiata]|uniref:eukaryotic translation initiation factor 4E-binding protein 2-like n=1 Tax=Amblyraja radiata TaxID=386614 RepID=UPI001402486D|nr:eukaryotic translation initiation factor 4E-binding protein 2-like [Amblyraja radiata]